MGCAASSEQKFGDAIDEELEREHNYIGLNKRGEEVDRFNSNKPQNGFESAFFEAEVESEEQFVAVKPWIGALVKPTNEPTKNLKLEFVNGWAVEDSRQNIFWGSKKDEIIYPAAALGIVMNINNLKQKFFGTGANKQAIGHTDNIVALGVCPKRKRVVTGSIGAKPAIIVWDSDSMQVLARASLGRNTRAVSTIRFSKDGKYFFCTDKHNDSNVYCFDADSGAQVGMNQCGADPVFDAETGDANIFAVATKRGIWFFQFNGGLDKKKGIFGSFEMTPMITVTWDSNAKKFYSGTTRGEIYTWDGNQCVKAQKLHEGSIMALTWTDGKLLSSGSKDFLIKISQNGQVIKEIQIEGYAKSLDLLNGNVLAGTKYGEILSINEQSGNVTQIMKGHWCGETWGLAIGSDKKVYTTADDNTIICFDPKTNKIDSTGTINEVKGKNKIFRGASTLSLLPPNQHSRAIAINKAGHVAIATNEGELSIRRINDLNTEIWGQKISKEWIEVVKYSPDESMLAVGSHDNDIFIYKVSGDNYTLHGKLQGHKSFITSLDWSRDSKFIQSNCGAYELLFFDVQKLQQLTSGATQLRDEKWATYTCKIGWWDQGIFPPATSGDHINGVYRNNSEDVIATGDDWGFVNLYGNPNGKGARCKAYRGHASHVVRVLFDHTDSYLYSVGGYDKTLMKWKVC